MGVEKLIEKGGTMALSVPTSDSVTNHQVNLTIVFRRFSFVLDVRAKGGVGTPEGIKDFSAPFQRSQHVTNSQVRVKPALVRVQRKHCHAGLQDNDSDLHGTLVLKSHQNSRKSISLFLHDAVKRYQQLALHE